jgi:hypothetical protein
MVHVLNHKIRHETMLQHVPSPAWCLSLAEQHPLPDLAKASLKEKLQAFRTVAGGGWMLISGHCQRRLKLARRNAPFTDENQPLWNPLPFLPGLGVLGYWRIVLLSQFRGGGGCGGRCIAYGGTGSQPDAGAGRKTSSGAAQMRRDFLR